MKNKTARAGGIALLALACAANSVAYPASLTRTSAFEYDAASGLLAKEIIEPDNPDLCLATTCTYDAYGNKTSAAKGQVTAWPTTSSGAW